ncbi:MAG: hypothetical protein A2085_08540 [Gemmatimonadetes bacterium GWC2_71_10]|nr:MAG: hypothetical protein A2085_08540 [Gemmatimonadetes bacterium GWC2_71_10]
MTIAVRLSALALLALTAACSRNPASPAPAPATAPAPAPAPAPAATPVAPPTTPAAPAPATGAAADVSGDWTWSTDIGGQVIGGSMSLTKSGTTYSGEVVPDGMAAATVRTLTIAGDRITIVVDTPDGAEAIVEATLTPDRRAFSGTLAFQGQTSSFSARRR